jgi:nucleotide-binding universal stress UspA family protein
MRFARILCPIDFDETSWVALDTAGQMAEEGTVITIFHVLQVLGYASGRGVAVDAAQLAGLPREEMPLREWLEAAPASTPELRGAIHDEIIELSSSHDLVIMGTHGKRGLMHAILGSTTEKVIRGAHCPVLVVHPKD